MTLEAIPRRYPPRNNRPFQTTLLGKKPGIAPSIHDGGSPVALPCAPQKVVRFGSRGGVGIGKNTSPNGSQACPGGSGPTVVSLAQLHIARFEIIAIQVTDETVGFYHPT